MEANGHDYKPVVGKIPGRSVNLGGVDFILAPLNLRQVEEFEETIKKLGDTGDVPMRERMALGLPVIHASLQRNYPAITLEETRELIDMGNFIPVCLAVVSVSGFEVPKPGEPAAASQ